VLSNKNDPSPEADDSRDKDDLVGVRPCKIARNEVISNKVKVAAIEDNMRETRLR